MSSFAAIFIAHLVGDFFCQTRWMANNKSHDPAALIAHVTTYTAILVPAALFVLPHPEWLYWLSVNMGAHLVTDAITSRLTSRFYRQQRYYAFFNVVGTDQTIHYLTLVGTWAWLA